MKIFGNLQFWQGSSQYGNVNSDGSLSTKGTNRYIMGVHQSAIRTSSGDFINYVEVLGTPACAQFNKTTGIYTCSESGFFLFACTFGLGTQIPGRNAVAIYFNGGNAQEIIDETGIRYGDFGWSSIYYLASGTTVKYHLEVSDGATQCWTFMSAMMVGS